MRNKLGSYITAAAFCLALAVLMLLNLLGVLAPDTISAAERRKLAQYPALTLSGVLNGSYMTKLESAALDQFTGREGWRALKAASVFNVFFERDKSGLYVYENSICKTVTGGSPEADALAVRASAEKLAQLKSTYFANTPTYFALIPDKGYYTSGHLRTDYAMMAKAFSNMEGVEFIDLSAALEFADYYRTDLHWDCLQLDGVLGALGGAMDAQFDTAALEAVRLGEFAGAYLGQLALPFEMDTLSVFSGGYIDGLRAYSLDEATLEFVPIPVYDAQALEGVDAYDAFLGGAKPVIVIENDAATSARELVVFRDSFTSSLAPLLSGGFTKITLVDLRYIASPALADYVDFDGATDALIIYGTELMLNSSTLLIK